MEPPLERLSGRELGRLLAALEEETWLEKRNLALAALMARAGLRVSEVIGLAVGDVELRDRSGRVLVRRGKGLKERRVTPHLLSHTFATRFPRQGGDLATAGEERVPREDPVVRRAEGSNGRGRGTGPTATEADTGLVQQIDPRAFQSFSNRVEYG